MSNDVLSIFSSFIWGLLGGLAFANFVVIVLGLSHHDSWAKAITDVLSRYVWVLRMGGAAAPEEQRSRGRRQAA